MAANNSLEKSGSNFNEPTKDLHNDQTIYQHFESNYGLFSDPEEDTLLDLNITNNKNGDKKSVISHKYQRTRKNLKVVVEERKKLGATCESESDNKASSLQMGRSDMNTAIINVVTLNCQNSVIEEKTRNDGEKKTVKEEIVVSQIQATSNFVPKSYSFKDLIDKYCASPAVSTSFTQKGKKKGTNSQTNTVIVKKVTTPINPRISKIDKYFASPRSLKAKTSNKYASVVDQMKQGLISTPTSNILGKRSMSVPFTINYSDICGAEKNRASTFHSKISHMGSTLPLYDFIKNESILAKQIDNNNGMSSVSKLSDPLSSYKCESSTQSVNTNNSVSSSDLDMFLVEHSGIISDAAEVLQSANDPSSGLTYAMIKTTVENIPSQDEMEIGTSQASKFNDFLNFSSTAVKLHSTRKCLLKLKEEALVFFKKNPNLENMNVRTFCSKCTEIGFLELLNRGNPFSYNCSAGYEFPENLGTEKILSVIKDYVHFVLTEFLSKRLQNSNYFEYREIFEFASSNLPISDCLAISSVFPKIGRITLNEVIGNLTIVAMFVIFSEQREQTS